MAHLGFPLGADIGAGWRVNTKPQEASCSRDMIPVGGTWRHMKYTKWDTGRFQDLAHRVSGYHHQTSLLWLVYCITGGEFSRTTIAQYAVWFFELGIVIVLSLRQAPPPSHAVSRLAALRGLSPGAHSITPMWPSAWHLGPHGRHPHLEAHQKS